MLIFLIGIIQTIFAKGLATPGRLAGHINGWDEIEPMAAQFDMDRIAEVTGIAPGRHRTDRSRVRERRQGRLLRANRHSRWWSSEASATG